jgi:CBS domain-containing protein
MLVRDVMTKSVEIASPSDTIHEAARAMANEDCGALPVGEKDRLIGMITDRDIVVRAIAQGKQPDDCTVRDVMSHEIKYVFEDETTDGLAQKMAELQIKRLPVINRDKRLVGIVSLCDLANQRDTRNDAAAALSGISRPSSGTATHAHI